jgi:hypothetical protein
MVVPQCHLICTHRCSLFNESILRRFRDFSSKSFGEGIGLLNQSIFPEGIKSLVSMAERPPLRETMLNDGAHYMGNRE